MTALHERLQALIADMDSRFTSGNSVPVRVTHLHATKWAEIRAALEAATALQSSGGEVVAWLCVSPDGVQRDATVRTDTRDDYRRFGRTITPLYASTAQPSDGWIAVADRLPELRDDGVLAYFSETDAVETVHIEDFFRQITNGLDDDGNQKYALWATLQGVTHWHPRPAPPLTAAPAPIEQEPK